MSRRKMQRGDANKLTIAFEKGVQKGSPTPSSRQDKKNLVSGSKSFIRIRSTTPTKGGK